MTRAWTLAPDTGLAHAMLPAQVRGLLARLMLAQHPYDLRLGELALSHASQV